MKILHTCIRVYDLEKSIKFYEMLGLKEARRKDHTKDGFILVYLTDDDGNYELELTYNIGSKRYNIGDGYSHIALSTNDLEATHKKFKDLGYKVSDIKGLPGATATYYFIEDPDGYKVEMIFKK